MNFTFYYLIFQLICIIYGLYLCFIMILGDNSQFPIYLELNLQNQKTPFSIFLTFSDPNDVQMTKYFTGVNFWKERSVGAKEANKRKPEGRKRWAHVVRFLDRVGPPILGLEPPMSSIFVPVPST